MYRYLVFDFDGTLADSQETVTELFSGLASKYGFAQLTPKEIKHRSGLPLLKQIQLLLFIRKVDPEFKDLYRDNIGRIRPVEGIADVLRQLNRMGFDLSIISSNRRDNIELFLDMHGLAFFTEIISTRGLSGKPKSIREFMRKRQGGGELLYIGDEIRDVRACNKAATDIAFVTWGLDGAEDISGLDVKFVLDDPSKLLTLVQR
jgi:phosphoglycolate phosphatase